MNTITTSAAPMSTTTSTITTMRPMRLTNIITTTKVMNITIMSTL